MDLLLSDFQAFWRENSEIWGKMIDYQEAAPHLILQAFLQRVVNGGGKITREMSAGTGRVDLCVSYKTQRLPIELKIRKNESTWKDSLGQLERCMDKLGCDKGWLVVFDQRKTVLWEDKLFIRKEIAGDKMIAVVGC
jgi:hypothetical protein